LALTTRRRGGTGAPPTPWRSRWPWGRSSASWRGGAGADGGLGCALLWPFDLTRYFAPWRPIPVSPIGLSFLSPYGLMVALTELVFFAPLFVYALRRRRA
jgi:hypothetical protein